MMASINSCKDCPDRYVGCHSSCIKYKEEKEAYERIKDEEHKKKDVVWGIREQRTRAVMAAYKRNGYKKHTYYP